VVHHGWHYFVLGSLLAIYPCWRIFKRVGLNPALSLFIFFPGLGWWIAGAILAFSRWPSLDTPDPGSHA
jgi:hypothetical protein